MKDLLKSDLLWILRRLPKPVFKLLEEHPKKVMLAGGFIRACIANEKPNDIDLFANTKEMAELAAYKLAGDEKLLIKTQNAYTIVKKFWCTTQVIFRWVYSNPIDILPSFDFTIAKAVIWYDGEVWQGKCCNTFYPDLVAKRLVYTCLDREEEVGGSLLRVLKFYTRGYRIPLDSFSKVITRLISKIEFNTVSNLDVLNARISDLLYEVDPQVDPTHSAHLPHTKDGEVKTEDIT